MFEPFGEIVSAKVFGSPSDGKNVDEDGDAESTQEKKANACRGYGFVCFTNCEDARKALEYFHEKQDESSVSMDLHSSSRGGDDSNSTFVLNNA